MERAPGAQATGGQAARGGCPRQRGRCAGGRRSSRAGQGQGAPDRARGVPDQAHDRAREAPGAGHRAASAAESRRAEQARAEGKAGAAVRRYRRRRHPAAHLHPRRGREEAEELLPGVPGGHVPPAGNQAEGIRRRSDRGVGPSGPCDHPFRDPAGRRRQGQPHFQPGQGPGAFPGRDQRAGGGSHPRQDHGGHRDSQRRPPDGAFLRGVVLARVRRSQVAGHPGPWP
ncbi:hypothetical protein D9M68_719330 [compost metagenome]